MRAIKGVLFPTDFSENARSALPAAIDFARRHEAVLHVVHVVPRLPWPALRVLETKTYPTLNEAIQRGCEERLQDLVADLGPDLRTRLHVLDGDPAEKIAGLIDELGIDLVALATKGQSGLEHFVLGSIAERIVRTAPCTVLVVRPLPVSWDALSRIVVPVDFSRLTDLTIDEAAALAAPHDAELALLHVLEETHYPLGPILRGYGLLDVREQTRLGVERHLAAIRDEHLGKGARATVAICNGVPSAAIADFARRQSADVIVIGTHGREGVARFFLGSTAERVVRLASCSVLVVKERP